MISKTLSRRLKRLEEATPPEGEAKTWQIVIIDSAGNREHGPGYKFRPIPPGGYRPGLRQKSRGR